MPLAGFELWPCGRAVAGKKAERHETNREENLGFNGECIFVRGKMRRIRLMKLVGIKRI